MDTIIIGGGPAGLTAAIYAVRYGLSVAVFESLAYGGQVATTPEVENYPGYQSISGFELSMKLYEQAKELGVTFFSEKVIKIEKKGTLKTITTEKQSYDTKTVILANGAKRRKLHCKGEDEFFGKGVSYCATCDGAFFKGKDTAIVGGGNTALEDALFLSNLCHKVYLVHRRAEFRGIPTLVKAVIEKENIQILYSSQVEEIKGNTLVDSIIVNHKTEGQKTFPVSALFVAIGTEPDNQQFKDIVELDNYGYIKGREDCKTSQPGIYVAGDSRTKALRQIVTATADGAVAAFMASNAIHLEDLT